jgi:hypothetical protein
MKRLPMDAIERGATRYSQWANLCDEPAPARGGRRADYYGCTRKPHKHGPHVFSDGKHVRATWPAVVAPTSGRGRK